MQLPTLFGVLLLLTSTKTLAQELAWNATRIADWALVGGILSSYLECLNEGNSESACLLNLCTAGNNYSPFLDKCCPGIGTNPSDSDCSAAFSGSATQSGPAKPTPTVDGDNVNCRAVAESWASCATHTTSFYAMETGVQEKCVCKPLTAGTSTYDDFYWDSASSCYNYLSALAPASVVSAYASALSDFCKPGDETGFGGAAAATTADSGDAGATAAPSSTGSNPPEKTNGAGRAGMTSWGLLIALAATQFLV